MQVLRQGLQRKADRGYYNYADYISARGLSNNREPGGLERKARWPGAGSETEELAAGASRPNRDWDLGIKGLAGWISRILMDLNK